MSHRKDLPSEVRMVVEVDGTPVGSLNLDIDRLWPIFSQRTKDGSPAEWIDRERFTMAIRAAVMKNLMNRLQPQLYQSLGSEIVKAELDVENFALKAEEAAQTFGRTKKDIEQLVAESGRTPADFDAFFWEYLLDERDGVDLKKEWKAARKGHERD